jgi:hypothetical protein
MPAVMKDASILIIDEAFALDGLKGLDGAPILVRIEDLTRDSPHLRSVSGTADLLAELKPQRLKLLAAVQNQPIGWIERNRLIAAGLTADDCSAARKLEWRAKIGVPEQATFLELQKAMFDAAGNRDLVRRAWLWRVLEKLLREGSAVRSGRAELVQEIDVDTGSAHRAIRLYDAAPIKKGWAKLPTLHLDATADITLIRVRVPHAELVADIEAAEPHTRVIQYYSNTFGKRALTTNPQMLAKV